MHIAGLHCTLQTDTLYQFFLSISRIFKNSKAHLMNKKCSRNFLENILVHYMICRPMKNMVVEFHHFSWSTSLVIKINRGQTVSPVPPGSRFHRWNRNRNFHPGSKKWNFVFKPVWSFVGEKSQSSLTRHFHRFDKSSVFIQLYFISTT